MTQDRGLEAVERGLREHFREQRQQFRAPADLWARIEDRLEPRSARRWRLPWLDLLRQVQPVYAGLAAALLVLVLGVATLVGPMLGAGRTAETGPAVAALPASPAEPAMAAAPPPAPMARTGGDADIESAQKAPMTMAAAAAEPAPEPQAFAGAGAPLAPALRFLALGDSYTVGKGVDASERWTTHLVQRLREEGLSVADVEMVARTGWTTVDLSAGMDDANPEPPYHLVTLMIGVNDQFRGRDVKAYRAGLAALLRRAVALAGNNPSQVLVLSIPDWSVTPFADAMDRGLISAEIERFNAVGSEETARVGARYVDITAMSREAGLDGTLLAADGLYPSGKMYQAWMELVLPWARAALAGE